jgi:hypothetical protein
MLITTAKPSSWSPTLQEEPDEVSGAPKERFREAKIQSDANSKRAYLNQRLL